MVLDLYGTDTGNLLHFRDVKPHPIQHPWDPRTRFSCGSGVTTYTCQDGTVLHLQPFVEVYPPNGGFFRGEGDSPAACEDSAWRQYQRWLNCPSGEGHDLVPWCIERDGTRREYRNGAGFCRHCGSFFSKAFTAEQLNQFCHVCNAPTLHGVRDDVGFVCVEHDTEHQARMAQFEAWRAEEESEEPLVRREKFNAALAEVLNAVAGKQTPA